jgi:hypothetical protein
MDGDQFSLRKQLELQDPAHRATYLFICAATKVVRCGQVRWHNFSRCVRRNLVEVRIVDVRPLMPSILDSLVLASVQEGIVNVSKLIHQWRHGPTFFERNCQWNTK